MIASYTNSKKENVTFTAELNNYQFATYLVNRYMLDNDIPSVFHMVYLCIQLMRHHAEHPSFDYSGRHYIDRLYTRYIRHNCCKGILKHSDLSATFRAHWSLGSRWSHRFRVLVYEGNSPSD